MSKFYSSTGILNLSSNFNYKLSIEYNDINLNEEFNIFYIHFFGCQ